MSVPSDGGDKAWLVAAVAVLVLVGLAANLFAVLAVEGVRDNVAVALVTVGALGLWLVHFRRGDGVFRVRVRVGCHLVYYYALYWLSTLTGLVTGLFTIDLLNQSILQAEPLTPFLADFIGREDLGSGATEALTLAERRELQWIYMVFVVAIGTLTFPLAYRAALLQRLDTAAHQPGSPARLGGTLASAVAALPRRPPGGRFGLPDLPGQRPGDGHRRHAGLRPDAGDDLRHDDHLYRGTRSHSWVDGRDHRRDRDSLGTMVLAPRPVALAHRTGDQFGPDVSRTQEVLGAMRVIKACSAEDAELRRFEADSVVAFNAAYRIRSLVAGVSIIMFTFAGTILLAGEFFMAVWAAENREAFAAVLIGLVGLSFARWNLGAFQWARDEMIAGSNVVGGVLRQWTNAQDMAMGLDRVFEILDIEPDVVNAADAVPLPDVPTRFASTTSRSPTRPTGRCCRVRASPPAPAKSRPSSVRRGRARAR